MPVIDDKKLKVIDEKPLMSPDLERSEVHSATTDGDSGTSSDGSPAVRSASEASAEPYLPDSMSLKSSGSGISSTLKINLKTYIDTFKASDEINHKLSRKSLTNIVTGVSGQLLWSDMLKCAMDNAVAHDQLSADQCVMIENSPMCTFMEGSFVEIVKNMMDEAVLGHYASNKSAQLTLLLVIDIPSPDRIELTLTDTGRGFSPSFLKKMSSPENRDAYIMEAGSSKEVKDKSLPALFGGAGLGLRILMAQVLHGDILVGPGHLEPKYEKPAISMIVLKNSENGAGAQIQIVTSQDPLQEKVINDLVIAEAPVNDPVIAEAPVLKVPILMGTLPVRKRKTAEAIKQALIDIRTTNATDEENKPTPSGQA